MYFTQVMQMQNTALRIFSFRRRKLPRKDKVIFPVFFCQELTYLCLVLLKVQNDFGLSKKILLWMCFKYVFVLDGSKLMSTSNNYLLTYITLQIPAIHDFFPIKRIRSKAIRKISWEMQSQQHSILNGANYDLLTYFLM